jgi:hypothetical protein
MLKGILSISGEQGLYKMVSQTKNGIIVESIDTKKRIAANASNKISSLEDIAIFTEDEEVPLSDVFMNIKAKANGKEAISPKASANEIKAYFKEILPDYDEDRVYVSDMKKVFKWYNLLSSQNLLEEKESKEEKENSVEKE